MSFSIITAEQRMNRKSGVKMLIAGPSGIGKTTLLKTLDPATTLFFDLEAGDLAVQDFPVDQMSPRTWEECRSLACLIGGPNPSLPDNEPYSQAHYDAMVAEHGTQNLDKYETIFVDSLTVASRLCFTWCKQQPRAFNKQGKPDLLGAYGLNGDELIAFATQLQRAEGKNVVMVSILESKTDDFNRVTWGLQMQGGKAGREIPGIVDEVLTYTMVKFSDTDTRRAFVTAIDNRHGYPAKDRSGRLALYEKPDLGECIAKITQARPATNDTAPATTSTQKTELKAAS